MKNFLKEIIFFVLFAIVVVIGIAILFYEFLPNQEIQEGSKYSQTTDTAKLISQIKQEKDDEQNKDKQEESVLKKYEVVDPGTKEYEKKEKKYPVGDASPFYDYTKDIDKETADVVNGINLMNALVSDVIDGIEETQKSTSTNQSTISDNLDTNTQQKIENLNTTQSSKTTK